MATRGRRCSRRWPTRWCGCSRSSSAAGRPPRATWTGDVVTVVLENTLTPAERNLVTMGEHERLRETRMFFQYATVREFCEPVERLTGRTVRAFISGIDTEIDGLAVETFILHPPGSDAPSRTEFSEPRAAEG